ncbi:7TM-DISM domain-containing protein [Marivirga arenosa]|uniref:7TM-DISM domain-containing protein n=1 Tax=Marivirga arenosa TaxID=3059076 RepID=A0AA49GDF3_9BACT|nr:7TM-DISM domain-containing protein [Marivirga sp. ABR2-2]WKK83451.2 7TM-DISM domain-containing protein [Marivirga sp. ABR2-2]
MNRFIICLILFIPFQGLSNWQREWDIAIDSSARLSVDEILNGDYFQIKDTAKIKSFGLTSNVIWMKSALDMPEGGSVSLDNPLIRYIDFFL